MTENEISRIVVDICFHIHKQYGPGLFESVYEEIICYELAENNISFKRQQAIPVIHKKIKMEIGFRADIIIEDKVILELKSTDSLSPVFYKQLQTYLKLTNMKLGLLINFHTELIKDGITRVVNNL